MLNVSTVKNTVYGWLSRESTTGRLIPEIDGLRFVAIVSVILYHLNGYITIKTGREKSGEFLCSLFDKGFFGVPLFFVISGFIISYPFARALLAGREGPELRNYYLRRLTRLEPPYIINLVIMFSLLVMVKGVAISELLIHLFASIFYSHNLIFGEHSLVNGVAWSLEVELQFYLLAPLLTSLFLIRSTKLRRAVLLVFIMGFSVASTYLISGNGGLEIPTSNRLGLSILNYAHYFLTGFLLVDIYLTDWREAPELNRTWDLVSVAAWLLIVWLLFCSRALQIFLPLAILIAYCGAFRGRWSNSLFRMPFIYIFGGMCYTTYLYHFQIISMAGRYALKLHQPGWPLWLNVMIVFGVLFPVIFIVCSVFFALLEKPFMRRDWHKAVVARLLPIRG